MLSHVCYYRGIVLADARPRRGGCRFRCPHFRDPARLRSRVLLQISPSERRSGHALQHNYLNALRALAPPACRSPRGLEQPRSAVERQRYLFVMLNCGRISRNDMVGSTNLPRRPTPYCLGDYPTADNISVPLPNTIRHSEDVES